MTDEKEKIEKEFEEAWEVAKAVGCSVCGMAEFQTQGRCGLDPNHSMRICPARRNAGSRERAEAIRELRMRRAR